MIELFEGLVLLKVTSSSQGEHAAIVSCGLWPHTQQHLLQ